MITTINCLTLSDIDNALGASWSGDAIIAFYLGNEYRLFEDTVGNPTNAHVKLINDSNTNDVYGIDRNGNFTNPLFS